MSRRQLVTFTRAVGDGDAWRDGRRQVPCSPLPGAGRLDGEQARSFYEGVLASSSQASTSTSAARKHKAEPRRERACGPSGHQLGGQRNGHLLLKSAQDGDLKMLRGLLETGASDINFRDSYYWTATMCAAYSGQLEAVRHLLSLGAAWVGVCDCTGRDALDLARLAGHAGIVTALEEYHSRPEEQEDHRELREERGRKLCRVCGLEYTEDSVQQHERSTLHLVSKARARAPTHYSIPDTNLGFRMMVRGGWDREEGLGPCGKGRKFPISTALKRDQRGLGFHRGPRPRVTHFQAGDPQAVQRPGRDPCRDHREATVNRSEERRREARGRRWERELRVYMDL
ncbi:G patch domain and ankyrin repeat-containing protein 1-like isoform X2 [Rhinoraja longicauda]